MNNSEIFIITLKFFEDEKIANQYDVIKIHRNELGIANSDSLYQIFTESAGFRLISSNLYVSNSIILNNNLYPVMLAIVNKDLFTERTGDKSFISGGSPIFFADEIKLLCCTETLNYEDNLIIDRFKTKILNEGKVPIENVPLARLMKFFDIVNLRKSLSDYKPKLLQVLAHIELPKKYKQAKINFVEAVDSPDVELPRSDYLEMPF